MFVSDQFAAALGNHVRATIVPKRPHKAITTKVFLGAAHHNHRLNPTTNPSHEALALDIKNAHIRNIRIGTTALHECLDNKANPAKIGNRR